MDFRDIILHPLIPPEFCMEGSTYLVNWFKLKIQEIGTVFRKISNSICQYQCLMIKYHLKWETYWFITSRLQVRMKQHLLQSMLLCDSSKQGPRCFSNYASLAQNNILLTFSLIASKTMWIYFCLIYRTNKKPQIQ